MTDPSDRLPDDYQDRIEALESELGRSVCGFPTEGLEPCEQWPAADSERCSRHKDRDLEEALQELTATGGTSTQSLTPQQTLNQPRTLESEAPDTDSVPFHQRFSNSYVYWGALVLMGLTIGAGTAVAILDGGRRVTRQTARSPQVELDFQDPDFNKIRQSYRQGNYQQVASSLDELIRKTSRDSVKAQGLYYSFVFHQNQRNYRRALEAAQTYLDQFQDHYRRAEVLYGAWFICNEFLEDTDRAERYRETLLEEFPDSKWANRLSS